MSGNIFISYRRSESPKDARAIYERLRREFGEDRVFIDLEGIEPGEDFLKILERQLDGCSVLVALIGRDWADAKNELGRRRLDDENDFVRLELHAALKRDIRVIPVLVDGALPPPAEQLPEELRPLVRRQAISLDFNKFDTDVGRLVRAVRKVLEAVPNSGTTSPPPPAPPKTPGNLRTLAWGAAIGAPLLAGIAWYLGTPARREARAPEVVAPAQPQQTPKRFRDCEEAACPWLVMLARGSFIMGSSADEAGHEQGEDLHAVNIGYDFAVMETEVTLAQYRAFVETTNHSTGKSCDTAKGSEVVTQDGASWRNPGFDQTDQHPVVCVNWFDAQAYAKWLSAKTGKNYRLLSESEWEYAARAGTTTMFSFGNGDSEICAYANVSDREARTVWSPRWTTVDCSDAAAFTAPVGRYRPNRWGLFDMHGNVWEWVQDCRPQSTFRIGPADGSSVDVSPCPVRVVRGGAWRTDSLLARSAFRGVGSPSIRDSATGIRLARTAP